MYNKQIFLQYFKLNIKKIIKFKKKNSLFYKKRNEFY